MDLIVEQLQLHLVTLMEIWWIWRLSTAGKQYLSIEILLLIDDARVCWMMINISINLCKFVTRCTRLLIMICNTHVGILDQIKKKKKTEKQQTKKKKKSDEK